MSDPENLQLLPDSPLVLDAVAQLARVPSAKSIAYSGTTLYDPRLFRLERGTQFRRAGQIISPSSQFGAQPLFSKVAAAGVTGGQINPTQPGIVQSGSIPPSISTVPFTVNATTTSITITWPATPIMRSDNTATGVRAGRIQTNGLVASTTYYFYPFWSDNFGAVGWVTGGVGIPPIMHTSQADTLVRVQWLRNFTPLSVGALSFATPASGTSTGTGGYGGTAGLTGCPLRGTKIRVLGHTEPQIEMAEADDWVYISTEDGHKLIAVPEHPVFSEKRGKVAVQTVSIGEPIITEDGVSAVRSKESFRRSEQKMVITLSVGHLYWANGILSHNVKPKLI